LLQQYFTNYNKKYLRHAIFYDLLKEITIGNKQTIKKTKNRIKIYS